MLYRLTISKNYTDISFVFDNTEQAIWWACETIEQCEDEIKLSLSLVKEQESDNEHNV